MKLLWYADALHFRRHGISMTGLAYKHMPYGALPSLLMRLYIFLQ